MARKYIKVAMFIVIILVLAVAVPALAMGPGGGGGGGGGGGHTETATNNLSWPTIMIGGTMNLTDPALLMPSGTPATGHEVPGYYYVQGVHTWQAEWQEDSFATGDRCVGRQPDWPGQEDGRQPDPRGTRPVRHHGRLYVGLCRGEARAVEARP